MSKLLIIGSGWEQKALVQEAKQQGHQVIASHPNLTTEGLELAETFFVKDSRDIASHLEIAKNYNVDGVVTDNCDYSLYTSSILAQALNFPFATISSARYSNNKIAQREACQRNNILQPKFELVESFDQLENLAGKLDLPLIVKPVDSRGTFGVTVINDAESLLGSFIEAIAHSPSRRIICEQFISGTLVTVDGFCFKNGHRSLAVASRVFEKGAKPITKEIIYPAQFDTSLNNQLLENHNEVVKALDYNFGHTHGEYIVTEKNEIFLVECANRGGGVYTSSTIVPYLTDINLNKILIDQSLGTDEFEVYDQKNGYMNRSVMLTFLDFEVGKVIKSINEDELKGLPYVLEYRTIYQENDMVESIENCASRHSMLVIAGKDADETYKNFADFNAKMKIEYYQL